LRLIDYKNEDLQAQKSAVRIFDFKLGQKRESGAYL
jgi:hypothetical protein